ncbi:hypothetical protein CFI10_02275 [Marinobacterium iners]|nr:hypothetical protein CFI10_02275 [Marinobacterium iners]
MADYHNSVKPISRSSGRSATGAAAYRSGTKIVDERTGLIHDYTRKTGVVSAELVLPEGTPEWATDRPALWNAAEQAETRVNSTVAREFELGLPWELNDQQRYDLAHQFAREVVAEHGCVVDVNIHRPHAKGDKRNQHAHLLCSTRRLTADGFTEKCRELDSKKTGPALVRKWRARWAELTNEALAAAGHSARVDHRSHRDRGLDVEPTVKLGQAASALERKAQAKAEATGQQYEPVTERGRINQAIRTRNANVVSLSDRLSQVEQQIRAERLRLALFNQPAAQLQQRLQGLRNVGAYLQQNPQYAALLHQYKEAQRLAGYSREYARMCRDDLAKYEREHPIVTRFVSSGLRKPDAEHAQLLEAVAEANASARVDSNSAKALRVQGDQLHAKLGQRFDASEPERLTEAERIEAVLADPEYQALERERAESVQTEPPQETEPGDDQQMLSLDELVDLEDIEQTQDETGLDEFNDAPNPLNGPNFG